MSGKWEEFLNPQSMITPGIAGGLTMFITNGVCVNFAELPPRWVALALSFTLGVVVWAHAAPIAHRAVYYVINSLIIFVMATGSNAIGGGITKAVASIEPAPSAYADVAQPTRLEFAALGTDRREEGIEGTLVRNWTRLAQQEVEKPKPVEKPTRSFFDSWF